MHRSTVAMYSAFFVPKSRKRYGCEIPAAAAISSVEVPWRPRFAKAVIAATSTASRRSSAVFRSVAVDVTVVSIHSQACLVKFVPECFGHPVDLGVRQPRVEGQRQ